MALEQIKMLIVEDDPSIRQSIVTYFKDCGAVTVDSSDGDAGYQSFAQDPDGFSVVLSDLQMSPVDGLDMISRIKKDFPDSKAIFAILSTEKNEDHLERSKDLGIRLWKLKPFDGESLETAISLLLQRMARVS